MEGRDATKMAALLMPWFCCGCGTDRLIEDFPEPCTTCGGRAQQTSEPNETLARTMPPIGLLANCAQHVVDLAKPVGNGSRYEVPMFAIARLKATLEHGGTE